MYEDQNKTNCDNWNYHAYIRVNDASAAAGLWDNFKGTFDAHAAFGDSFVLEVSGVSLRLTSLPDVHFITDVQYDGTPKAARQTLLILTAIALVIVIIAGINFTNLSTALTPMRVKSINTQKVLGARVHSIRIAIVAEAVIICAASFLIALLLVSIFRSTPLAVYVDGNLRVTGHPVLAAGTALLALLVGILAGAYPARYMTSFAPALILKGNFGLSPKGRKLRSALVGMQFVASMALIIGAAFMFMQNRFMQRSPLGYDRDALLTVDIRHYETGRDALANDLKNFAGIDAVTFGERMLSSSDQYMGWWRTYRSKDINFQVIPVDWNFLEVMGIHITEGRNFRREDAGTENGAYIFNEAARSTYQLELNTSIDNGGEVIGFMPDVRFASFRTPVVPMGFYVWGTKNWGSKPDIMYIRVKAGADMRAAVEHVRSMLAGINADYPFNVRYYDDVLQRLYEKERSLGALITIFSAIAIFIAIVGVFGMVVFDSECRRKEVSIRKVLGASTRGIIIMFCRSYLRILAVCFVIAAPVAWYAANLWLENFAYKTPMYWWVYALVLTAITVITLATVTFQNWKVANDNPVNNI
jgi:putative ABC transport system permease protein